MTQFSACTWKPSNLFALLLLTATMLQARRITSRRLIIHVPVKLKTHHHTHTVYKVLHGGNNGGVKQTIYKLVGFSGEGGGGGGGTGHGSHGPSYGHSHSHSHGMGGGGMGEITYEDRHGCESGKLMPSGHRDMMFNHYARHDQQEELEEEEAEAEAGGYAEERDEFIDVRDAWL